MDDYLLFVRLSGLVIAFFGSEAYIENMESIPYVGLYKLLRIKNVEYRSCKNFCVNGYLVGNYCAPRDDDGRSKESPPQGVVGLPSG